MHIIQVPPEAVESVWPLAESHIAKAVNRTDGATSVEKERASIIKGDKQLWMVIDTDNKNRALASGVTSLQKNENGTITANIELLGGDNMKAWLALKDEYEKLAKEHGVFDVRMWARKGWSRELPDYKLTHYILRKVL